MRHHRIFVIACPLILLVIAAIIIIPGKSQEQKLPRKTHQPRKFDENRFPIADYTAADPSDQTERLKRQVRGKKYDKSEWRVHPDTLSDSMVRVDHAGLNLPALPLSTSSAVIIGQVTAASAYLSNDKTGVYSVFTVQVIEALKNVSKSPISSASLIEVERDGGRVRFPNGRLHLYLIGRYDMPQVGLRYVLFLTNPDGQPNFQIVTGYELREGKVYPLDDLPNLYFYENVDEESFLKELRIKTANP